ncbi:MAG TPA: hypothetical protein DCY79_22530 [Planctomycetaceae bacterium]|nr:hypothetical protein [Planctomycetaceae bacterium]
MAASPFDHYRTDVGRFFDDLSNDYTAAIERCFPKYREMLIALLDYLPADRQFSNILELGCGTGNLTILLRETYPDAALQVVDVSSESLQLCRERLTSRADVTFTTADFRQLDYSPNSFDLVISSIAIHHLPSPAKQTLFQSIYHWLSPDGVFTFADQCAGATPDLDERHLRLWQQHSAAAGATAEEWQMWMAHQTEHDHHDSLVSQLDWLRDADFATVDCTWRCWLWSVLQARKNSPGSGS